MSCKVCGCSGPSFCLPCRSKYGGKVVRVSRPARAARPRRASAARPRRRRRAAAPAAARAPRRRSGPLSRVEFLKRMRAGKLRAARARAAGRR